MGVSILAWLSSRDPYCPETQSRANMGRGMITRPIWKCPCIKLFITYFWHLEKIWKWSCSNPITGYFSGVKIWTVYFRSYWSYKNAFIWTKYVINIVIYVLLVLFWCTDLLFIFYCCFVCTDLFQLFYWCCFVCTDCYLSSTGVVLSVHIVTYVSLVLFYLHRLLFMCTCRTSQ